MYMMRIQILILSKMIRKLQEIGRYQLDSVRALPVLPHTQPSRRIYNCATGLLVCQSSIIRSPVLEYRFYGHGTGMGHMQPFG